METRKSNALTKWLPLSAVAAGATMVLGSLLGIPQDRIAVAAIASGVMTFSAFLMRSYGREKELYQELR